MTGRSITIATLDAGYGVARVFAELEARRIEAIVPTRREPSPKKGVIPARRFKLDSRHDRLRCPRGRHLVPHSKPNAEGFKVYRSSIRDCRPCPLRAACFSPNAQRRTSSTVIAAWGIREDGRRVLLHLMAGEGGYRDGTGDRTCGCAGLAILCWWSLTGRRASSAPSKNASAQRFSAGAPDAQSGSESSTR